MMGKTYFIVSIMIFVLAVIMALLAGTRTIRVRRLKSIHVLFIGIFLAALCLFFPIYVGRADATLLDALFFSVTNSVQVFFLGMDGEALCAELVAVMEAEWSQLIRIYISVLLLVAPVLTFGVILSFFGELVSRSRYMRRQAKKDTYLFSDLNTASIVTAKDIRGSNKKAVIVFCGRTKEKKANELPELTAETKKIRAITLEQSIKDIIVKQRKGKKKKQVYFFFVDGNENRNVEDALAVVEKYNTKIEASLYVMANSNASEAILDNALKCKNNVCDTAQTDLVNHTNHGTLKLMRINQKRSLVYWHIFKNSIFENAREAEGKKTISYLIAGAGDIGIEMLKAVIWCGQMEGYEVEVTIADHSGTLNETLKAMFPELMARNGVREEGECYYRIQVLEGVDVTSGTFFEEIENNNLPTHILVAIGNDELNIETAMKLRSISERGGCKPEIYAVVYSDGLTKLLTEHQLKNYKNQSYDICCIGSRKQQYSFENITNSGLWEMGKIVHEAYGDTEENYRAFEYNQRSSIATAIHTVYKKKEGLDLTLESTACLEHLRWNAYMRTEGYVYGVKRNDLAKQHSNLVPYQDLREDVKEYDREILRKFANINEISPLQIQNNLL